MCTVVILRRPGHDWPLLIGANRDEMKERDWLVPMRHWEMRKHVVAGLDEQAGGTWLGINDEGVVACILNRFGTLGSHPDYRTRGELPLEALDHADAKTAADSLAALNPEAYRPFNMVIADYLSAYWVKNDGAMLQVEEIGEGISMLSAREMNDEKSDRIKLHLPRFRAAPAPEPDHDDWMTWQALLSSRKSETDVHGAMEVETDSGFETTSSSLIALPKPWNEDRKPIWKFCSGKPSETNYDKVSLD